MGNTVLKISNLSKRYGSFSLEGVNISIEKGKIAGFIGVNGAGKTTVIKLLAGLVIPDSGRIEYFGESLNSKNESSLKDRIAFLLDGDYFYPELTLNQMKNIVASAYSNWDEAMFKKYVDKFNLPMNKKIVNLSKGMKTQYLLSLALSHNAELIIMDEPTSGLDPLVRIELMRILSDLSSQGVSILFSSHLTHDLEEIADEIVFIHKGQIVFQKSKSEIRRSYFKVKDKISRLNPENKKLFLHVREETEVFTGVYKGEKSEIISQFPDSEVKSATVEEVMIGSMCGV